MKKTKKQWNDTIIDMRRNGAQVTEAEASAIISHLLKTAGK
jgi:hypothetical protein